METPLLHPSSYAHTLTNMTICLLPVLAKTLSFLESIRGGYLHDLTHCIDTSESSSFFFSWHMQSVYIISGILIGCLIVLHLNKMLSKLLHYLWDVRLYISSWVLLFSDPFIEVLPWSILRIVPSILHRGQARHWTLWWDLCYLLWFPVVSSFSWYIIIITIISRDSNLKSINCLNKD